MDGVKTIPDPTSQPTITVADAAALLSVSRATLYRNLDDVPHLKIGGTVRIVTAELLHHDQPLSTKRPTSPLVGTRRCLRAGMGRVDN